MSDVGELTRAKVSHTVLSIGDVGFDVCLFFLFIFFFLFDPLLRDCVSR